MVCVVCRNMLGCQDGRYAKGTHDILYDHHKNARTFQQAIEQDCYICRALHVNLLDHLENNASQPRKDSVVSKSHTTDERKILLDLAQQSFNSEASLFLEKPDRTYRLEIRSKLDQISFYHTFRLEYRQGIHDLPDQKSVHVKYRSLRGDRATSQNPPESSLHRDFSAVHKWLKMCRCYSVLPEPFYPTRLISLENIKASMEAYGNPTCRQSGSKVTINLVETANWNNTDYRTAHSNKRSKHYVTLSHCWGKGVSHRLLDNNYENFKQGVPIEDLPRTFKDAVYFAASLDGVDYIWIDSLCIIQENKLDWAKESADMHRVYSNSFLNLSATAASNSHGGLFRDGDFELLSEEEIAINIEGLPQAYDGDTVPKCLHERSRFFTRRCKIVDASFWDNQVNKGPVNTRGWVLQERLMSPRIVHFCHDQVGWECSCRDVPKDVTASGKPRLSASDERSRYDNIVEGIRQRMLDAESGADSKVTTSHSPFDLWAAVVNAYTKTRVTFSTDKLVALSGLAKIISRETNCAYVAGLWRAHLANQLLWHVEPAFDQRDRSFSNPADFDGVYRAPSFSWAAIDVTGHGITYAKVTKQKLFVTVEDTLVDASSENEFGFVSKAQITLQGKLRKARLMSIPNNRFAWHLVDRGELDTEPHRDVYLDCPSRDVDCIDDPEVHVYVLPVAEEITYSGTTRNLYLICLILRLEKKTGTYKRVGITKLSPFMDREALAKVEIEGRRSEYAMLKTLPNDAMLPHAGFDAKAGEHKINLI